jgi:hypothetical protein
VGVVGLGVVLLELQARLPTRITTVTRKTTIPANTFIFFENIASSPNGYIRYLNPALPSRLLDYIHAGYVT